MSNQWEMWLKVNPKQNSETKYIIFWNSILVIKLASCNVSLHCILILDAFIDLDWFTRNWYKTHQEDQSRKGGEWEKNLPVFCGRNISIRFICLVCCHSSNWCNHYGRIYRKQRHNISRWKKFRANRNICTFSVTPDNIYSSAIVCILPSIGFSLLPHINFQGMDFKTRKLYVWMCICFLLPSISLSISICAYL